MLPSKDGLKLLNEPPNLSCPAKKCPQKLTLALPRGCTWCAGGAHTNCPCKLHVNVFSSPMAKNLTCHHVYCAVLWPVYLQCQQCKVKQCKQLATNCLSASFHLLSVQWYEWKTASENLNTSLLLICTDTRLHTFHNKINAMDSLEEKENVTIIKKL